MTQDTETPREKSSLFLRRLHESLAKNNLCNAVIAKAIIERLEIREEADLVVATIRDVMYEGFIRQPSVHSEMKALTREVWGSHAEFLIVSGTAAVPRKRARKVADARAVVDPLFESHVGGSQSVDASVAAESAAPSRLGRAGASANQRGVSRGPSAASLLAQALSVATDAKAERAARVSKAAKMDSQKANTPPVAPTPPPASETTVSPLLADASPTAEKSKKSLLAALGNINKMSMPSPSSASITSAVEYEPRPGASAGAERSLDPEFTFQSFVQGSTNEMASLACLNASRDPGNVSNPVFIYGSTGLGKTHLLHAVGNEIKHNHPDWHVRYVTSEDLISDLTRAVRFNKQHELRTKYRQVDVLLVDDIQFIEGKDGTQLEFFHIFNDLYQNKKQIVITSDQYPKSIPNIEERLKSRFLQGLIASIEPPTFEDRVGIIEVKAEAFGLPLKRDHIEFIATHVKSNVREITGVLKTLLVNQSIKGEPPTLEAIQKEVRKDVRFASQGVDIFSIQKLVAEHFGVKLQELRGTSRKENFVAPRHVAMYLAREMLDMTTTEIADAFNRRDHTTVLNAVRRITDLMAQDASTLATVKELRRRLEHATH